MVEGDDTQGYGEIGVVAAALMEIADDATDRLGDVVPCGAAISGHCGHTAGAVAGDDDIEWAVVDRPLGEGTFKSAEYGGGGVWMITGERYGRLHY